MHSELAKLLTSLLIISTKGLSTRDWEREAANAAFSILDLYLDVEEAIAIVEARKAGDPVALAAVITAVLVRLGLDGPAGGDTGPGPKIPTKRAPWVVKGLPSAPRPGPSQR